MEKEFFNKKHVAIKGVFVVFAVFAAMGVAFFANGLSNKLQANIFQSNGKIVIAGKIIAQLMMRPAEIDPATVCEYTAPKKPDYKSEFLSQKTKVWAAPGGDFEATFYLKNTGNVAWFGDFSTCKDVSFMRLGTARTQDRLSVFFNPGDPRWINANRIAMVERRVDPGEIATFTFSAKAPTVSDIFREYFQPVADGAKWLGGQESTAYADIYVGDYNAENEQKLFYLGVSGQASAWDLSGAPIVEVDISKQKLWLKFGDTVVREYTVSTGTFKTPTPLGNFKILNKQELRIGSKSPHYRMPKWQGFSPGGAGFHALPYLANDKGTFWTEALNHIGQRVSHGCVRLLPDDAEEFFNLTQVGMKVVVHA